MFFNKTLVVIPQHTEHGVTLSRCTAVVGYGWNETQSGIEVRYRKYTRAGARLQENIAGERLPIAAAVRRLMSCNENVPVTFHAIT